MEDTRKPPLSVDADEIESVSRRYCFRGNWGNRKRRSTRLPKPVKTKASGSQKNPKRKRESNDNSNNTKERKHDNHVAPIQMIERKSVTVKKGANLTTAEGGLNNMEKSKCKVVSTVSKIVGRKALDDVSNVQGKSSRKVVHDGPKLMKYSSPELKNVNQAATSIPKENAGISDKGKERSGYLASNAGKEVAPQVNNGRNHLWKNQVSDGFIIKDQTNIEAHALPRKSIRVTGEVKICSLQPTNTQAQRTSKSKNISDLNKQKSVAAISSKNKEDAVASSLPENIAIVVPHEAAQGQLSFDADGNPRTVSDIISGRNLDGRRSYTSSLMSLEKCGEVVKLETLPCIDDNRNQLEVTEYVDEIYQYYWDKEAQNLSLTNYLSLQTNITAHMRGRLINFLLEAQNLSLANYKWLQANVAAHMRGGLINFLMKAHSKFRLMEETLYLMVTLLDRYLSQAMIKNNELWLVGLTILWLASKYEERLGHHLRVEHLISHSSGFYTRDQILAMEWHVLKQLNFHLNVATPYVFMLLFLKASQSDTKLEHLAFYLIELCLVEYEALKFKPSLLCASAIYVARCTLHLTPVWTPLLRKHTHCEESQLRDCAEMILRFHKTAGTGHLRLTYQKYMMPVLSGIAAVTALDRLPL
ncbi:putative cyclin-B3-1 isoform X2 [Corylus avellana]|uniref:putative cyclin-B3-1 isoform X2 n=1 Tax=Corylus avellana TaxID=13451 RepID=UPI00286AE494|nr:putative cyclin-B3-1 isoform X2 [Corylus avellana]